MTETRRTHWDKVYEKRRPEDLTWFQEVPETSLSLIRQAGIGPKAPIIDVGGGTSSLPSSLLDEGYGNISVLDVSSTALSKARERLGPRAGRVDWIEADVLRLEPSTPWALWHDRAVFHFLTSESEREAYLKVLGRGLQEGGHLIMATFALDGPSRCSGLDCVRYSPNSLESLLGSEFSLRGEAKESHRTPAGGIQAFSYAWFQRAG